MRNLHEISKEIFSIAEQRLGRFIESNPDAIPTFTIDGKWHIEPDSWAPVWTGGFLDGQCWLIAKKTGDPWWMKTARDYSDLLEPRKNDLLTHDIGFIFTPSWGNRHENEPSERTREVLITAGRTMAKRFNKKGKYLCSWVDPGSTFIDIMMNTEIIAQAGELSGEKELCTVAHEHSLTSRKYLIRGDGSSVHEGWFDPVEGEFLKAATHQGFRSDSCWVRGLTWAISGFTTMYTYLGDLRLLETAEAAAKYYMEAMGERRVPPNDFDEPNPKFRYEASSGAIAVMGFTQLTKVTGNDLYKKFALETLDALTSPAFVGTLNDTRDGILGNATYHERNGLGVQESVMWGDYYLLRAITELENITFESERLT